MASRRAAGPRVSSPSAATTSTVQSTIGAMAMAAEARSAAGASTTTMSAWRLSPDQ